MYLMRCFVQGDPGELLDSQQGLRGDSGEPGHSGVPVSLATTFMMYTVCCECFAPCSILCSMSAC